ncbi:MAG: tetratricopeptide repeat protein [Candidatus Thorarchaeota archaeon]|nr:MAG: tetratricopeptide repeat protein [Candidatus Thorarchaeota archaeon]
MASTEDTLSAVEKHLETHPDDAAAWNVRGVLLANMESFGEALRCFDRSIRLESTRPEAHLNRGRVLLSLGDDKAIEALKSFDRAMELKPGDLDVLRDKARALRILGRSREELMCYVAIVKISADEWPIWLRMGNIYLESGQFDRALKHYDRALAIDEKLVPALVHRAVALSMLKRWKDAIKSAEAATKLSPEDIETWRILADANLRAGKYKSAKKALKKASELDPEDAAVELTLGMVEYKDGRPKDAIRHFKRALIRRKNYPAAWRNLAMTHMELEEWDEARIAWEKLVSVVKDDPMVFDAQATTYARLDDFCSAADAWESARKLYKKKGDAVEAQRVTNLGRAARINCSRQKKAARAQREHDKAKRTFDDRFELRRKKKDDQ